jgi:diadenylate cyclase
VNLQEWLSALTWRDGLDFFLLFLIIYALLRVVQGTRAAPVLVGVAVFGVLAWIVRELDLIAVASLLRYFFESIIILLIVVFQRELRRLLIYLGQRLLPGNRRHAAASAVGELVGGLERLQKARIGALVILQGEIDVLEAATGRGSEVDAPLKGELIVALMIPHSANTAHDGAILVQELRIARAGVICPLSDQQLDPRFGTRHRAAIGCSEETDALVIVLSEERGELRLAHRGTISDALDPEELEFRITEWLAMPRAEGSRSPNAESRADLSRADLSRTDLSRGDSSRTDLDRSEIEQSGTHAPIMAQAADPSYDARRGAEEV